MLLTNLMLTEVDILVPVFTNRLLTEAKILDTLFSNEHFQVKLCSENGARVFSKYYF